MIGYEWTSVPGGNNLHRNILFRDNKDKADQIMPFSAWQSEDPEKLWEWMAKYEEKTGAGCWRFRTTPTCPTAACSSRSTLPASR